MNALSFLRPLRAGILDRRHKRAARPGVLDRSIRRVDGHVDPSGVGHRPGAARQEGDQGLQAAQHAPRVPVDHPDRARAIQGCSVSRRRRADPQCRRRRPVFPVAGWWGSCEEFHPRRGAAPGCTEANLQRDSRPGDTAGGVETSRAWKRSRRQLLRELADRLGVGDRVHFAGYIGDKTDIIRELHTCTVFALPSSYEGLPMALLEAMSTGTAVVGSDIPAIAEVVTHGKDGLLHSVGDSRQLRELIVAAAEDGDRLGLPRGPRSSPVTAKPSWARDWNSYALRSDPRVRRDACGGLVRRAGSRSRIRDASRRQMDRRVTAHR